MISPRSQLVLLNRVTESEWEVERTTSELGNLEGVARHCANEKVKWAIDFNWQGCWLDSVNRLWNWDGKNYNIICLRELVWASERQMPNRTGMDRASDEHHKVKCHLMVIDYDVGIKGGTRISRILSILPSLRMFDWCKNLWADVMASLVIVGRVVSIRYRGSWTVVGRHAWLCAFFINMYPSLYLYN